MSDVWVLKTFRGVSPMVEVTLRQGPRYAVWEFRSLSAVRNSHGLGSRGKQLALDAAVGILPERYP